MESSDPRLNFQSQAVRIINSSNLLLAAFCPVFPRNAEPFVDTGYPFVDTGDRLF